MLQISQIEKPRCSATIDQMRLRWATALPLDFQKFSSSGFHSEIQVGFRLLIPNLSSAVARASPSSGRAPRRKGCANVMLLKESPTGSDATPKLCVLRALRL